MGLEAPPDSEESDEILRALSCNNMMLELVFTTLVDACLRNFKVSAPVLKIGKWVRAFRD
jgi:hypothetical protein